MRKNLLLILLGICLAAHADVTEFLGGSLQALTAIFVQIADARVSNGIRDSAETPGWRIYKDDTTGKWLLEIDGVVFKPDLLEEFPEIEGLQVCQSAPSVSLGQRGNGLWYETRSLSPSEIVQDTVQICSLYREQERYYQDLEIYK